MSTEKHPIPSTPFDYRAENLRIQGTASSASLAAKNAEEIAYMAESFLRQARKDGDAQYVTERERIVGLTRQQAAAARQHANQADLIARHFDENLPTADSVEARMRTRGVFQAVLSKQKEATRCRDEAARVSGIRVARSS